MSADCFQLHADHEVWVNLKEKYVVVGGQVCLREGVLEMFACPRGTKEHESVVSTNSPARFVHAGLLMIGARSGPAMQYHPVYKPAGGTEIDVEVVWEDAQGTLKRVPRFRNGSSTSGRGRPWTTRGCSRAACF